MPPAARAHLINVMTNRHLENLRVFFDNIRNAPPAYAGQPPVNNYQLPDQAVVHQTMTNRVNALMQQQAQ